jgi:hypothetical protein
MELRTDKIKLSHIDNEEDIEELIINLFNRTKNDNNEEVILFEE